MPGRNPAQAREAFLKPLRRGLSCITTAQIFIPDKKPGDVEALVLSQDPLPLHSPRIGGIIQLILGHQFRVVEEKRKSWHVSTTAYHYYLRDDAGHELIGWHWHPGRGTDHPHVHVPASLIDRRVHVPTGRVSIESVLRLLLTDLQVAPAPAHADDFLRVLDECEAPFIKHRRWHAWKPS